MQDTFGAVVVLVVIEKTCIFVFVDIVALLKRKYILIQQKRKQHHNNKCYIKCTHNTFVQIL